MRLRGVVERARHLPVELLPPVLPDQGRPEGAPGDQGSELAGAPGEGALGEGRGLLQEVRPRPVGAAPLLGRQRQPLEERLVDVEHQLPGLVGDAVQLAPVGAGLHVGSGKSLQEGAVAGPLQAPQVVEGVAPDQGQGLGPVVGHHVRQLAHRGQGLQLVVVAVGALGHDLDRDVLPLRAEGGDLLRQHLLRRHRRRLRSGPLLRSPHADAGVEPGPHGPGRRELRAPGVPADLYRDLADLPPAAGGGGAEGRRHGAGAPRTARRVPLRGARPACRCSLSITRRLCSHSTRKHRTAGRSPIGEAPRLCRANGRPG